MEFRKGIIAASKGRRKWIAASFVVVVAYWFCLPATLFRDPFSTVLEARNGELLSASIASDGQWRFPPIKNVPSKFGIALITFEDKRFYSHPGIDLFSFARAIRQNLENGRVVSGASTLTMQTIRLSRKGKSRTLIEKAWEMILATRLELRYSKDEILALYASHAPFGGNVVGLEAACWRYFGRSEVDLSWGEAAFLAVLPNAPALVHPGKNRDLLKRKRDLLLQRLLESGAIDSFTHSLAVEEPIPSEPLPLPRYARHLIGRAANEGHSQSKVRTTIDFQLQQTVEQILQYYSQRLNGNQIHNAATLVARVATGEVVAYVGNTSNDFNEGRDVDIITSPRSTGSILKPFLYAALMDDGKLLPKMLLPDVPTFINGFAPKNFTREYDGAVAADKALIRSLNVPAVHMLKDYRYERFYDLLKRLGMTSLNKPADHYGLSLILGGAEGTLWDITGMYGSIARTQLNYFQHPGQNRYEKNDIHPLTYTFDSTRVDNSLSETSVLSASSIFSTLDVLRNLYRPGEETGWRYFQSSKKIAWKTGTSFGFRDGWAIGVTPEYVVGVWVGNADGEGRPGLTGTDVAAPIMFDVFSKLAGNSWFKMPKPEMEQITVCQLSGYRNSDVCPAVDTVWVTKSSLDARTCPHHKRVHLTKDKKFQVNSSCSSVAILESQVWFVLPPVQEYYYRSRNMSYRPLPPFKNDCQVGSAPKMMDLVYPKSDAKVLIPRDISGNAGNAIFQLAHRNPKSTVFWHIDGNFVGSTQKNHNLPVNAPAGKHVLMIIDEQGELIEQSFEVISTL